MVFSSLQTPSTEQNVELLNNEQVTLWVPYTIQVTMSMMYTRCRRKQEHPQVVRKA